MLAKVVAHADSRAEAAARLAAALDATEIHGVVTNRAFLAALLRDPDFLAGAMHTDFLDRHPDLLDPPPATPRLVHLAAAVAVSVARRRAADPVTGHAPPGFRPLAAPLLTSAQWRPDGGEPLAAAYRLGAARGDTSLLLELAGEHHELRLLDLELDGVRVRHEGVDHRCAVAVYPDRSVWVNDGRDQSGWHPVPRLPDADTVNTGASAGPVADLPGTIVHIAVEVGQRVTADQKLVVIEAMKMEHPVTAADAGIVTAIPVTVGQYVEANTTLVTLTKEATS
jgi:3-methylcrotonyl-CoA carboxylase alpha subunit